jgi:proton glutamate symport protein
LYAALLAFGLFGLLPAALIAAVPLRRSLRAVAEPATILGIDALMDMGRTAINVVGKCLASVVVVRWEGEFGSQAPAIETMDALPVTEA